MISCAPLSFDRILCSCQKTIPSIPKIDQKPAQELPGIKSLETESYLHTTRLQGRTSDIAAWTKTMQPAISISEAQNQLLSGHQDIRTYFPDTAAPERNTNETLATANTTTDTTATGRIGFRRPTIRQRLQQTRTQPASIVTNSRQSRYQDIRNLLS